jgi:hypothetical protein
MMLRLLLVSCSSRMGCADLGHRGMLLSSAYVQIEDARGPIVREQRIHFRRRVVSVVGEGAPLFDFTLWDLRFTLQNAATGGWRATHSSRA